MSQLLDGKSLAKTILAEIKAEIDHRKNPPCSYYDVYGQSKIPPPCLAVLLCSEDPASEIYIERKREACREVGINSTVIRPFENGLDNWPDPFNHLCEIIKWLNEDRSIHGILLQLPLMRGLNQYQIFDRINPLKDVDVFVPENVGLLLQGRPRFVPCTPAAIQELLVRNGISTESKKVAIINRSDVVGKPLKSLLIQDNERANATVTMCHDRTPPDLLKQICLSSDIIVVAVGKPNFLTADMVPEGCVVLDVGINRIDGVKKVVGDVDFEAVSRKAAWLSPVPGGVGPVVVAKLLENVLQAQKIQMDEN
jgi:methylenetetrahydrofolate dehydrogenase (NADP+) / methenyltetrahydrofolate cyclohydrolase